MIKLIISDIDGTLVPDGTDQINSEIFNVIETLYEKGIRFAAASGRQFISIKKLFEPVSDKIFYIPDGGSVVRTLDETIFEETIPQSIAKEVAKDILSIPECDMMICGMKGTYVMDQNSKMAKWLSDSYHFDVEELTDLDAEIDDEILKVSLYHESDAEGKAEDFFMDKWKDTLQLSCAGIMWIDCSHKNANKGIALKHLQEYLKITKEETMAFGDNINDLEMIENAGISYAIGNARDEIKAAADRIADTNVNDGVLKELKKLLEKNE
ncbi:MAG: HAD family hydrolase [Lachnospiraceae bacterium]|nr:HAD family hydrolase [Lachnospiraceae bacterium]MDD3660587.1 HAD family hydrolase [Lachnospiraceae bacterium]